MSLHRVGAELVNDSPVWPEMNAGSIVAWRINASSILGSIVSVPLWFLERTSTFYVDGSRQYDL